MPFFKGRRQKVDPYVRGANNMVSPTESISPEEMNAPAPYPATLKYQLEHLSVDSLEREDDSEDGIERTSFPPRDSCAQSITLPLNMPVLGTGDSTAVRRAERRRVQPLHIESRPNHGFLKPARCFLDPILRRKSDSKPDTNECRRVHGLTPDTLTDQDIQPHQAGKWFPHDIDKLSAFRAKYRLHGLSRKQIDTEKDWTASPKNFYKSILKQRQKEYLCNNGHQYGHTTISRTRRDDRLPRRVSFSTEALLFSFIDDNLFGELHALIKGHKIDVNSCPNARGLTPLHRAVEAGAVKCVSVLLQNGADVNLKDTQGRSVLDSAMRTRHFECLAFLIESGANIEEYTIYRLNEFKSVRELSKTCYKSFEMIV